MNIKIALIIGFLLITGVLIGLFLNIEKVSAQSSCFIQVASGNQVRYKNIDNTWINIADSDKGVTDNLTTTVTANMSVLTQNCSGGNVYYEMNMCYLYNNAWTGCQTTGLVKGGGGSKVFTLNGGIKEYSVGFFAYYCIDPNCEFGWYDSEWKQFFRMHQDRNQVTNDGVLSAKFTVPLMTSVMGPPPSYYPSYYILVGTDPSIRANRSPTANEPQLSPYFSDVLEDPEWRISWNISNFTIPNLTPGQTYYWRIRQEGTSVTNYYPGGSFTASVDNVAPTSTFSVPSGVWLSDSYSILTSDYDNSGGSGLKNCQYRVLSNNVETKPWTTRTCSGNFSVTAGATADCRDEGADKCKVEIRSTDNANNISPVATKLFNVDYTAPVLNFTRSISAPLSSDPITLVATGTDTMSGIIQSFIYIDQSTGLPYTKSCAGASPCTHTVVLDAGNRTVYAGVTDYAGNSTYTPIGQRTLSVTQAPIYISYYDAANTNLKFAKSTDEGATWAISTLDGTSSSVGQYSSIKAVSPRIIYISYRDSSNEDVKFIKSVDSGATWSTPIVIDGASIDAGFGISLDSPDATNIFVAYYDRTNNDLKFAKSTDSGTTWATSSVDSAGNMGANPSLKSIDADTIFISYYDWTNNQLRFAKSTNGGISWTKSNVAAATIVAAGQKSSHIDAANVNNIAIGFYTSTGPAVKLAYSTNGGGTWIERSVPMSGTPGRDIAVSYTTDGTVFIGVGSQSDGDMYSFAYSPSNNTWSTSNADSTSGTFAGASSVYFTNYGTGYIGYHDGANNRLKFTKVKMSGSLPSTGWWVNSIVDSSPNVGWLPSLSVAKTLIVNCGGNITITLNPSSVDPSASFIPTSAGLSNCDEKTVTFKEGTCSSGTNPKTCSVSGSGCSGSAFTAPVNSGNYTYSACIDKNNDSDFGDTGESAETNLNVRAPIITNCLRGDEASGLISVGTDSITGTFGNTIPGYSTGVCILDSKAIIKHKIPTYEYLKSKYFDQSKIPNKTTLTGNPNNTNLTFNSNAGSIYYVKKADPSDGNLTLNGGITGNKTGVIFVDGNLSFGPDLPSEQFVHGNADSGLVFVVKGNVIIDPEVQRIDAVIISSGTIYTAGSGCDTSSVTTPSSLSINGTLISLKDTGMGINFCRRLANNTEPAEKINTQVKYLAILRDIFAGSIQRWSEVP